MSNLIYTHSGFIQIGSDSQAGFEDQTQIAEEKILPLVYMPTWVLAVAMMLGDFVVVWRAWVLFQCISLVKAVLATLMIGNIGINIVDCIFDNLGIKLSEAGYAQILDWLSVLVSMVVNMFATSLIAWKAWQVIWTFNAVLNSKRPFSM
ncbi:hypothetical protein GYMLUDRAFT_252892 [Collybiopsis luxurians FD-317 M1]|uniref:Uncharacterized protein n=1 Tax=Collybiopsis luxurians FD-317 M1 TaxID=944289 RepID=A0A0D0BYQ7_9AGAR|nr:hypothetical protein GYMLUDRAFT_252892 [Collybiopsis luxurians FD-317 M1]